MEETLSTLDYALRAKSIRNKPELNQRMSRNALLRDYIAEIERLKADILATREKNGIYFSEENWKQICDDQELQATELAEAKKQVAIVEKESKSVREEYDESIALLKRREEELKETKERLEVKKEVLAHTKAELDDVRVTLEEETIVRKAHQHTEIVLDGVASGLNKIVKSSLQDVSDLFSKLGTTRQPPVCHLTLSVPTQRGNKQLLPPILRQSTHTETTFPLQRMHLRKNLPSSLAQQRNTSIVYTAKPGNLRLSIWNRWPLGQTGLRNIWQNWWNLLLRSKIMTAQSRKFYRPCKIHYRKP